MSKIENLFGKYGVSELLEVEHEYFKFSVEELTEMFIQFYDLNPAIANKAAQRTHEFRVDGFRLCEFVTGFGSHFFWCDTPEGSYYWQKVDTEIELKNEKAIDVIMQKYNIDDSDAREILLYCKLTTEDWFKSKDYLNLFSAFDWAGAPNKEKWHDLAEKYEQNR